MRGVRYLHNGEESGHGAIIIVFLVQKIGRIWLRSKESEQMAEKGALGHVHFLFLLLSPIVETSFAPWAITFSVARIRRSGSNRWCISHFYTRH